MKISPIQKKVMQAMKKSNVDSSTAATIMTFLPQERQLNILMAWVEWYLNEYGENPPREEFPMVMDEILKEIPTPGIRIVASAE